MSKEGKRVTEPQATGGGTVLIRLLIKRHCLIVLRVQSDSSILKTERGKRQEKIKEA